ncbi:ATP-dependent zinc metalloprotease FtsH [Crocosphaera chwakensis]|uniref:ATP-dependent zinc metalloprotease FtsH n=1 Tax=Crocosphaera chwakensis CCY0110 TaxID=391612 RepID=A3IU68_9CHRO|nr:ATP-dependent zinc metalloprotease FtsH [Crocosphaera chwakensis]EAZ89942.1 cell division protein; FtsH [Crocosphaera chwakensis CCY0110]
MGLKNNSRFLRLPPLGSLILMGVGVIFFIYLIYYYTNRSDNEVPIEPYSEFLEKVENNKVARVKIGNSLILYQLKSLSLLSPSEDLLPLPETPLGDTNNSNNPLHGPTASPPSQAKPSGTTGEVLATIPIDDPNLPTLLQEKGIIFEASPPPKNSWVSTLLAWVIPPIILVLAMQFLLYRNEDRGSLAFSKSKAKVYVEGEAARITFADVAGAEEAKTELVEIVEFLKNPDRFSRIGARIPKGVLLVGPPGTGKTLLAKAVAGEAGVTFFSISASEFVELFVGTGAARVRDLFEQAKKQAPCIIFIDELDAIGKSRSGGNGLSGSNDEREQTLNQLLTEMDGFAVGDATVIVLAATNRPETLDSALLRPGRFDRQVLVDRPDLSGRLAILEIYAQRVEIDPDVNLKDIATHTPGFAGADLANLVNEAALLAARNQREYVTQEDFKEAIERVVAGLEKKSRVLGDFEKKIVAYHEVGHALVGAVMPGGGKVSKISIVPRGLSALGYTLKMPTEDRFLMSDTEFRQQIAMLLGGRAAEEIVFGSVTNGASDDLQRATDIAERMVTTYGMSKVLGPLAYEKRQQANFLGNSGVNPRRLVSEETAKAIDEEVKQIVDSGHQQALSILNRNRDLLEQISQQLLAVEVIEGEELHQLLNQVKDGEQLSVDINQ